MADTYSARLGLIKQESGSHANEWGDLANLNFDRLDSATRGYIKITLAGAESLDANDITGTGSTAQEESFFHFIELAGTAGAVTVPAENCMWIVRNNSDGAVTWTPSGGTGASVPVGATRMLVYGSNGTTMVDVTSELAGVGVLTQAYDADLSAIAALATTDGNFIVGNGSAWVAESGATARTSLGLTIGTDVQAYDAELAAIAALATTDGNFIVGNGSTWVAESGATVRTSLGLTIGTDVQAYDATIVVDADIGSTVQAYDADLTAIAALATTDSNFIVGNGSTWVAESGATARTSLGLTIGTDVQAYDAELTAIAALATTDGNFIVGNGSTWVAESGATVRTSLGLTIGTDVQAYDAELAALAGLTSAANKVPYFTGSGTAGVLDFLDEDTMTSDSATGVPSQQSVKAYVDTQVASGGVWAQITADTAITAVSNLDITWDETAYNHIRVVIKDCQPGTDSRQMKVRLGHSDGATFYTGTNDYMAMESSTANASSVGFTNARYQNSGNAAGEYSSFILDIYGPFTSQGGAYMVGMGRIDAAQGVAQVVYIPDSAYQLCGNGTLANAVDSVRFYWSSGSFAATGTYAVYGLTV